MYICVSCLVQNLHFSDKYFHRLRGTASALSVSSQTFIAATTDRVVDIQTEEHCSFPHGKHPACVSQLEDGGRQVREREGEDGQGRG